MNLLEKIPEMDDESLRNLLSNARRLSESGVDTQKAAATEILPALEEAVAARRAVKLQAAAEARAARPTPARKKAASH
jgi:hypothetical protein